MGQNKKHKLLLLQISKTNLYIFGTLFLLSIAFAAFKFAYSYKKMSNSVQEERIESVRQAAYLITDRVNQLRNSYVREIDEAAWTTEHANVNSLQELSELLSDNKNIFLMSQDGIITGLDGKRIVVDTSGLIDYLLSDSDEIFTSFKTIQTKGDYWLFSKRLHDVTIAGVDYIGIITLVDSIEYSNIAAIRLYSNLGESIVVTKIGTIRMRSSNVSGMRLFNSYNILADLKVKNIPQNNIDEFRQALNEQKPFQMTCETDGIIWLIISLPDKEDTNLVVSIPISKTAEKTYAGLRETMLYTILLVMLIAAAFIFLFIFIMQKNQEVQLNQEKAMAKSSFLDKMSHDIRTPLNAIVGALELADKSFDDQSAVRDYLNKAMASGQYLVSVINDVLDISRIEKGKLTIGHKSFDMEEILEHVLQIEKPLADEKHIQLQLDKKTQITTDFVGDPIRISQCLMNLVNNAVKFTPEHGKVRLSFEGKEKDSSHILAQFTVSDSGIGMSEEFMKNLFQPFEQEQNSMKTGTPYSGSGLGLSIVRDLVELMGGTVSATSKKGVGSTFEFSIPLEVTPKTEKSIEITDDESFKQALAGKKVLLAEDNAINREIIKSLLNGLNLDVDEAENGKIAVDKFSASLPGTYSLILMDIMMPVMDGLDSTRAIRKSSHPDSQTIPIIALSANAFEEDVKKSIDAGMQSHLSKPVDMTEMKKSLLKYVIGE